MKCRHKTLTGYVQGCRTETCRKMHADYMHNKRGYLNRRPIQDRDFPGEGKLKCVICSRPYVEHRLTESCSG